MSTLLITHPACLHHLTPAGHPERPDRLRAINRALAHERFQSLVRVEAPAASLATIALCHPMSHVAAIREATPKEGLLGLDADTTLSPGSFDAALRAAGGAVHAVDEVMAGKAANAFVATRPPGHHTETARPMGFCLFNNAAIAARYAQKKHGIERAAVVDFDVHHGNGSQGIFWSDRTVMYGSTHHMPLYPGTGAVSQRRAHNTVVNPPPRPADAGRRLRNRHPAAVARVPAGPDRDLRRLRRPHARPARQPQSARSGFRLGDPQAHGYRRRKRRRAHRVRARRRLRPRGLGEFGRRPRCCADAGAIVSRARIRKSVMILDGVSRSFAVMPRESEASSNRGKILWLLDRSPSRATTRAREIAISESRRAP